MKTALLLIVCLLLTVTELPAQTNTPLAIPLHTVTGYKPFLNTAFGTSELPSDEGLTGIPKDLTDYLVRIYHMQPSQAQYEHYLAGKITRQAFEAYCREHLTDTNRLSKTAVKEQIYLLTGNDRKGNRIIIVDVNNNRDFSDDQRLTYSMTPPGAKINGNGLYMYASVYKIVKELPVVQAEFEYYDGHAIQHRSMHFKPVPYNCNYTYADPKAQQFHVELVLEQHQEGSVDLNGKRYQLYLTGGYLRPNFDEAEFVRLKYQSPDSLTVSKPEYRLGQLLDLGNQTYEFVSVSRYGDTLWLAPRQKTTVGFTEGKNVPFMVTQTLEDKPFLFNSLKGSYVLFDFWGSWCKPCLEGIDHLKQIAGKYPVLKIVSIAYEKPGGQPKLKQIIQEKQMQWTHLLQWQNDQSRQSPVVALNIEFFPTFLLVDPTGKIIYRGDGADTLAELTRKIDRLKL